MDDYRKREAYETDTMSSFGLRQFPVSRDRPYPEVEKIAKDMNYCLIVRPSRGKYYYLKGFNGEKSYKEIKNHLLENVASRYKHHSKCCLYIF
jgi:hypothetical protein